MPPESGNLLTGSTCAKKKQLLSPKMPGSEVFHYRGTTSQISSMFPSFLFQNTLLRVNEEKKKTHLTLCLFKFKPKK